MIDPEWILKARKLLASEDVRAAIFLLDREIRIALQDRNETRLAELLQKRDTLQKQVDDMERPDPIGLGGPFYER